MVVDTVALPNVQSYTDRGRDGMVVFEDDV